MGHFAKINADNIVEQVTVISNCAIGSCIGKEHWDYQEEYHADHTGTTDFPESEALGQAVLAESGLMVSGCRPLSMASFVVVLLAQE